jgi:tRNA A-37 threonylcarbamoyl transferase component Bud32
MTQKNYINSEFLDVIKDNGFDDFETLWSLEAGWFEEPNKRRGGWSGVSKCQWTSSQGRKIDVFLKRQENHNAITLMHPIKGVPTFAREMENIITYQACDIPTMTPVYFAQRKVKGDFQAMLVTESLEGYRSLEDYITEWEQSGWPAKNERKIIIDEIARIVALLHKNKLQHNCLYPKHLFMQYQQGTKPIVRFIDLEKTRLRRKKDAEIIRDLGTFYRHLGCARLKDQLYFMQQYFSLNKLDSRAKKFCYKLQDIAKRKKKK